MRLPKPGSETTIAYDKYRNRVLLHGNTEEDAAEGVAYDLQTDGRVCLTPKFARELATVLLKFAKTAEARRKQQPETPCPAAVYDDGPRPDSEY